MDFNLTEDRRLLQESLSRYLRDNYEIETRHGYAASADGFSREVWNELAELGIVGVLHGEENGGFGGAGFDIAVVFEELGRALCVEPFLASGVLAGSLVADLGDAAQKDMLEEIIAGARIAALAHFEPQGRYDAAHVAAVAEKSGEGWRVSGAKSVVLNGDSADTLVVSARTGGEGWDEEGISLFIVPAEASGVSRRTYPLMDGGRAAEVTLEGVEVGADALLGPEGGAYPAIERALGAGVLAVCAEALGLMEVLKDATLEYLRTRKQFGQPIGKFQALQHRMAELLIEIEQARSAVINAAGRFEADRGEREKALSAAKHLIGQVGRLVAEEAIQLHGGIGVTWEYGPAHYAKRLIMIDHVLGDTDHHLARYIALSTDA